MSAEAIVPVLATAAIAGGILALAAPAAYAVGNRRGRRRGYSDGYRAGYERGLQHRQQRLPGVARARWN